MGWDNQLCLCSGEKLGTFHVGNTISWDSLCKTQYMSFSLEDFFISIKNNCSCFHVLFIIPYYFALIHNVGVSLDGVYLLFNSTWGNGCLGTVTTSYSWLYPWKLPKLDPIYKISWTIFQVLLWQVGALFLLFLPYAECIKILQWMISLLVRICA